MPIRIMGTRIGCATLNRRWIFWSIIRLIWGPKPLYFNMILLKLVLWPGSRKVKMMIKDQISSPLTIMIQEEQTLARHKALKNSKNGNKLMRATLLVWMILSSWSTTIFETISRRIKSKLTKAPKLSHWFREA